ncbi:MAG: hypothetical protein ACKOJF_05550, partial [Planctomycetaceae bacterium]
MGELFEFIEQAGDFALGVLRAADQQDRATAGDGAGRIGAGVEGVGDGADKFGRGEAPLENGGGVVDAGEAILGDAAGGSDPQAVVPEVPVELAGLQQLFENRFEGCLGELAGDRSSERVGRGVRARCGGRFFEKEVELAPVGELAEGVAEGGLLEVEGGCPFEGGEDRLG